MGVGKVGADYSLTARHLALVIGGKQCQRFWVRLLHNTGKLGQPAVLLRDILAVDAQSREVTLIQIPFDNRLMSMGLRTPPPTRQDVELEEALLSFAESVPGCHAHQVTRNDNGPELRSFHDASIKMDARLLRKFGGQ